MDMKSISQKLQDDIRAIMEAGLHPNQQKIDVHEPEKDEITAHDFKKLRAMKKDSNGKITKEDTDEQIQELAGKAAQQAAIAISLIKAGKKDGKMPKPMKEDSVQEEEKKKVVSPFDYKNYKSEIPKKPGELTGHDSKKISTGTVYTKKPVKEDADLDEARKLEGTYSHSNGNQSKVYKLSGEHHEGDPYHVKLFKAGKHYEPADYFTNDKDDAHSTAKHMVKEDADLEEAHKESKKEFVARQGRLAAAGTETAKDPARLKRMSNIPGYSAAMDLAKKTTQGAKHTKEDVEQMDELSMQTMKSAKEKLKNQAYDAHMDDNKYAARNLAGRALSMQAGINKRARRVTKEEVEQKEYTFAEYLDAARTQYVDEDAVLVANEAFKNKDITLFSDQSQSPEA